MKATKHAGRPKPETGSSKLILCIALPVLFLVAAIALFVIAPWQSPLEGRWVKVSGDGNAPESIRFHVEGNRLRASFANANPMELRDLSVVLVIDGHPHPWSGESDQQTLTARRTSSYSAWIQGRTLHLDRMFYAADGKTIATKAEWQVHGLGRLAIVNGHSTTVYKRDSWIGAIF